MYETMTLQDQSNQLGFSLKYLERERVRMLIPSNLRKQLEMTLTDVRVLGRDLESG